MSTRHLWREQSRHSLFLGSRGALHVVQSFLSFSILFSSNGDDAADGPFGKPQTISSPGYAFIAIFIIVFILIAHLSETCYRIWDALFLHGADTLLFVALAFLRGIQDDVLKAESMVATNLILRERAATCQDFTFGLILLTQSGLSGRTNE